MNLKPSHRILLLLISLLVKSIMAFYFLHQNPSSRFNNSYAVAGGDTHQYLPPIDNLVEKGTYAPDYRMPGYGVVYFIFRLTTSQINATNLLLFFQIILSAISVFYLALLAFEIFQNRFIFYSVYLTYLISTYASLYDVILLTESFCTSAFIFYLYYFSCYLRTEKINYLLISGLFLTWTIFLRPIYVLCLPLSLLIIFIYFYQQKKILFSKAGITALLSFAAAFFFFDGNWTTRNAVKYHSILPLSLPFTSFMPATDLALISFVSAFGGDCVYWNPKAEINWFGLHKERNQKLGFGEYTQELPATIYTSKFNRDSLLVIKKNISQLESYTLDSLSNKVLLKSTVDKINAYTASIQEEKPFLYHITSRIIVFKKFFFHSGTYNLFAKPAGKLNKLELCLKYFYTFLYLTILMMGMIGLILLGIASFKNIYFLFFSIITGYAFLIHPFLRFTEYRYLVPCYPLLVVSAVYAVWWMKGKIFKKNLSETKIDL